MQTLKLKDMERTFVSIFRNLPGFDGKSLVFVMKLPGSRVGGLAGLQMPCGLIFNVKSAFIASA